MNKSKKTKKILICLFIAIVLVTLFVFLGFVALYNSYSLNVSALTGVNNGVSVFSADMNETLCNSNRSLVSVEELPDYVLNAFIDIEDKRFYSHHGYDLRRILKASIINITSKSKSQGASTISQQLVKNALLTNDKTYSRKLKEVILSMKMERKFSKKQILEMYLNTIYFGSNAYGLENASKLYFNKSAKDLTPNEACCLAGVIKSPAYYSPKTNYNNSIARRNIVAKNMYHLGDLSKADYNDIISSDIKVCSKKNFDYSYEEEAIFEACSLLGITERELINRQYSIITHKDESLQNEVIKINNDVISNAENQFNTSLDSLSIVADSSGRIKAYYGNSMYNLHNLKCQPASTLKPFAVYLPCMIHNILTPASVILDEQIDYSGFSPKNADGKYYGYVSTREALSQSLNIPAVKALDYVGVNKARDTLTALGINIKPSDLNLSLALGATKNGVKILDLLNAYVTLSNLGIQHSISFVDKIVDKDGKTIYSYDDYSERIFTPEDCYLLTDMLKDAAKTGTAKRLESLNLPVASKTGTAYNGKNNTDLLNIAYTTENTLLSWVSNIKNGILPDGLYSSVQPTEINKQILSHLYSNNKPADFEMPAGIIKSAYDLLESEKNHRIVAPTTLLDRYIAYDYFKKDNPPPEIDINEDINLDVKLSKKGAYLTFNASKYNEYKLTKTFAANKTLLANVKDYSGNYSILDNDIFKYDEVVYQLEFGDNITKNVTIRPKDFLINQLNSEILTHKKKWYV